MLTKAVTVPGSCILTFFSSCTCLTLSCSRSVTASNYWAMLTTAISATRWVSKCPSIMDGRAIGALYVSNTFRQLVPAVKGRYENEIMSNNQKPGKSCCNGTTYDARWAADDDWNVITFSFSLWCQEEAACTPGEKKSTSGSARPIGYPRKHQAEAHGVIVAAHKVPSTPCT